MSYSNAYIEKAPKKRKVWLDEESYREVRIKNKERVTDRHRNESLSRQDMDSSDERPTVWGNKCI